MTRTRGELCGNLELRCHLLYLSVRAVATVPTSMAPLGQPIKLRSREALVPTCRKNLTITSTDGSETDLSDRQTGSHMD